jgi:2,3-bisphosphoglycerate-dependent phosphoglycerate mutase
MRIYLVRHGQSEANVDPEIYQTFADHAVPLSQGGKQQVQKAGDALADYFEEKYQSPRQGPWTPDSHPEAPPRQAPRPKIRLWCSPYLRTRQTADAIEAATRYWLHDRRENVLLCEQQFGLFDGKTDAQLQAEFPREQAHYQKCEQFEGRFWARMPLGESRFDVATRIHQFFGTIHRDAQKHQIEDVIIVCHGVTLRAFVMMWCHKSPEWFETEPNPKNAAVRLIEDNQDMGYVFPGFANNHGAV